MILIDGKEIRDEILAGLRLRVGMLAFQPVFCDVLVGDDPVAKQYVAMKEKIAGELGIATHRAVFPETITTEELIEEIGEIAAMPNMAGLIVQLPLPSHIDTRAVLDAVPLSIDVDTLSSEASERFYDGDPVFVYPTAAAVLAVLETLPVDFDSMSVAMVGNGMLVGRPVSHLLQMRNASVDVIDSDTEDKEEILRSADIVISATGQAGLITGDMIQEGAIVIDAGTSESGAGIAGDINRASVEKVAGFLSPVPGGVGPVTVAMLMQNVVLAAERMS